MKKKHIVKVKLDSEGQTHLSEMVAAYRNLMPQGLLPVQRERFIMAFALNTLVQSTRAMKENLTKQEAEECATESLESLSEPSSQSEEAPTVEATSAPSSASSPDSTSETSASEPSKQEAAGN